jgi:hypothetical protein
MTMTTSLASANGQLALETSRCVTFAGFIQSLALIY